MGGGVRGVTGFSGEWCGAGAAPAGAGPPFGLTLSVGAMRRVRQPGRVCRSGAGSADFLALQAELGEQIEEPLGVSAWMVVDRALR